MGVSDSNGCNKEKNFVLAEFHDTSQNNRVATLKKKKDIKSLREIYRVLYKILL